MIFYKNGKKKCFENPDTKFRTDACPCTGDYTSILHFNQRVSKLVNGYLKKTKIGANGISINKPINLRVSASMAEDSKQRSMIGQDGRERVKERQEER